MGNGWIDVNFKLSSNINKEKSCKKAKEDTIIEMKKEGCSENLINAILETKLFKESIEF